MKLAFPLLFLLLFSCPGVKAQDTALNIKWALTSFNFPDFKPGTYLSGSEISHNPTKKDKHNAQLYKNFIGESPTKKNYDRYYKLACSLWELGRMEEARIMFSNIVASTASYYKNSYYHGSDVPGDTTTNVYGYGSFITNYKHYACCYLAKTCIEEKDFERALQYITDADKKYELVFNCGTGSNFYRDKIRNLYALCYEGMGKNEAVIDLFLNSDGSWDSRFLVRAIQKIYPANAIADSLAAAESSLVCIPDSIESIGYETMGYGTTKQKLIEYKFTSGKASIMLFGRLLWFPEPYLKKGDKATAEFFLGLFKESGFYTALKEGEM